MRFGTGRIAKSRNDIPEGKETAVDGDTLFDTVTYRSGTFELHIN